uniref:MKLP1_Arf_bdg domain-containing protein n=1 Tax=Heterorhabditis bacteriophora TaxID=37862 RepID=A0A1I7WQJ0_HETBA
MLEAVGSMGFQVQPLSHRQETKHRSSSGEHSPNVPHHSTDHNTTVNPLMTADEADIEKYLSPTHREDTPKSVKTSNQVYRPTCGKITPLIRSGKGHLINNGV